PRTGHCPATGGVVRVALVTEGTYPYRACGVSSWCHQLVTGLRQAVHHVVALTGTGAERRPADPLPPHLGQIVTAPIWDPAPAATGPSPGSPWRCTAWSRSPAPGRSAGPRTRCRSTWDRSSPPRSGTGHRRPAARPSAGAPVGPRPTRRRGCATASSATAP